MANIDIKGISKAKLLAGLYNRSRPLGTDSSYKGRTMPEREAELFIRSTGLSFDFILGRPIKADLSSDELNTYAYDRDVGKGTAQSVVDDIRAAQKLEADKTPWQKLKDFINQADELLQISDYAKDKNVFLVYAGMELTHAEFDLYKDKYSLHKEFSEKKIEKNWSYGMPGEASECELATDMIYALHQNGFTVTEEKLDSMIYTKYWKMESRGRIDHLKENVCNTLVLNS